MNKKPLLIGAGALVGAAVLFVLDTVIDGGAFKTIEPHFEGTCTAVHGVVGAEDITVDHTSGFAYISSHDRREWMRTGESEGGIYRYRPGSMAAPLEIAHDMEMPLHPHGISLWKNPNGGPDRLFVVNHPNKTEGDVTMDNAGSQVEVFEVMDDRLRHIRSVKPDEGFSLNDVAADGPDSFYATIDKGSKTQLGKTLETFGRLARGGIARGNEFTATRIMGDLVYPNGIQVSGDGRTVLVAETTGSRILAYDRADDGTLSLKAEMDTGTTLDNIEWGEDGSIWIGAHAVALKFPGHAKDGANRSPSQVLRLTFDGEAFEMEEIYLNDGEPLSGSSVAAPAGNRFLIGGVFDPLILDCGPKEGP
ncbi:SMP-30/gluconolactonase/LRE family protein [Kordiimonas sp.]|uniref:SMP-30/gluconolactonase/LRE family protein n=1 Tax=Kordiimonas sp. TaxID=1970157 RepID=UPI003A940F35